MELTKAMSSAEVGGCWGRRVKRGEWQNGVRVYPPKVGGGVIGYDEAAEKKGDPCPAPPALKEHGKDRTSRRAIR
jgi:hypothetical protein